MPVDDAARVAEVRLISTALRDGVAVCGQREMATCGQKRMTADTRGDRWASPSPPSSGSTSIAVDTGLDLTKLQATGHGLLTVRM